MINIEYRSRELTKIEEYLMTQSPDIRAMKNIPDGTVLDYDAHIIFTDTKDNGETSEILSVLTKDKAVYSAQSKVFRKSLENILSLDIPGRIPIKKISGSSKAGRPYINCTLAIEEMN